LYSAAVHSLPMNSDGATVVLEGKAMSGGNLLLNHWGLSLDSFWLVDVPLYAIAVLIAGVHPQLMHLVPAVIAAGVVVTGVWIARRSLSKWSALFAAGTVVVILGLPTHAFTEFYLLGPLHVATTLWCLFAFIALRRARFGWGWVLALCLLSAGLVGDFQTLVLGVLPIGLAGLIAMVRTRQWRVGVPALAAALGSVVLAKVVRVIARAIGTFTIGSTNPMASLHQMLHNARHVITWGAAIEGVGKDIFGRPSIPPILQVLHAVGLSLGVLGVAFGVVSIVHSCIMGSSRPFPAVAAEPDDAEATWLGDVLVLGFLGGIAMFVALALSDVAPYGRYLTPSVIFGAIIAGRLAGKLFGWLKAGWPQALAVLLALAVIAGCGTTFASYVTDEAPVQPATLLVNYLEAHHLSVGVADYWSASIVTVQSSGKLTVRPVDTRPGTNYIARYMRNSNTTWYSTRFQFLVFNAVNPWDNVEESSAVATFGKPRTVTVVSGYRVLTWAHGIVVPGNGGYVLQGSAKSDKSG